MPRVPAPIRQCQPPRNKMPEACPLPVTSGTGRGQLLVGEGQQPPGGHESPRSHTRWTGIKVTGQPWLLAPHSVAERFPSREARAASAPHLTQSHTVSQVQKGPWYPGGHKRPSWGSACPSCHPVPAPSQETTVLTAERVKRSIPQSDFSLKCHFWYKAFSILRSHRKSLQTN